MVNKKPVAVLYGGSFDPPHRGHQKIVDRLVLLPYIDKVVVVPAYLNPFKSSTLAPAQKRLEWCRRLFEGPKVVVDAGEVEAGKSVYTIDTFNRLNDIYNLRYIAIGSDNLSSIEKWKDFETLNKNVIWLVFERDGHDQGYEKLREYISLDLNEPVSSSIIRKDKEVDKIDQKISSDVKKILIKDHNG